MKLFKDYYSQNFNIKFEGNIACAAHVINLVVQDILNTLKLNPPKNDEFFEFLQENQRIQNIEQIENEQGPSKFFIIFIY